MPRLTKLTPSIHVNLRDIQTVAVERNTDFAAEEHVVVTFSSGDFIEIDPDYTIEEIVAALNGGCYYRKKYTDECGDIDVCVLHNEISDVAGDPFALCRARRPSPLQFYPTDSHQVSVPMLEDKPRSKSWRFFRKDVR